MSNMTSTERLDKLYDKLSTGEKLALMTLISMTSNTLIAMSLMHKENMNNEKK